MHKKQQTRHLGASSGLGLTTLGTPGRALAPQLPHSRVSLFCDIVHVYVHVFWYSVVLLLCVLVPVIVYKFYNSVSPFHTYVQRALATFVVPTVFAARRTVAVFTHQCSRCCWSQISVKKHQKVGVSARHTCSHSIIIINSL